MREIDERRKLLEWYKVAGKLESWGHGWSRRTDKQGSLGEIRVRKQPHISSCTGTAASNLATKSASETPNLPHNSPASSVTSLNVFGFLLSLSFFQAIDFFCFQYQQFMIKEKRL